MQFIDTHLHLQDYKTGFATDIVKEALTGGVDRLVCAVFISYTNDAWYIGSMCGRFIFFYGSRACNTE